MSKPPPAVYKSSGSVTSLPADNSLRCTTSISDFLTRQLAAVNVYRLNKFPGSIARGVLTVTYADGGSDNWIVAMPAFSDGGINATDGPTKLGNGQANCG